MMERDRLIDPCLPFYLPLILVQHFLHVHKDLKNVSSERGGFYCDFELKQEKEMPATVNILFTSGLAFPQIKEDSSISSFQLHPGLAL